MDDHSEQTRYVKRVVLPGGETIEVVYTKGREPALRSDEAGMHVCVQCSCALVYPVQWEESGPEDWYLLLHCPNCDVYRQGIHSQRTVDAFDEELNRGAGALARLYEWLVRANMAEEIGRFVHALNADAILPEDF
ncbi:MAG: hypothetical protein ABWY95_10225 [Thermoleophilaceae bacterium]